VAISSRARTISASQCNAKPKFRNKSSIVSHRKHHAHSANPRRRQSVTRQVAKERTPMYKAKPFNRANSIRLFSTPAQTALHACMQQSVETKSTDACRTTCPGTPVLLDDAMERKKEPRLDAPHWQNNSISPMPPTPSPRCSRQVSNAVCTSSSLCMLTKSSSSRYLSFTWLPERSVRLMLVLL